MAISSERFKQLQEQFIPVKKKIDDIDRKYSLDYVEPTMDLPESLDLPLLEYVAKTEQELRRLADERTYASYLADVNRLNSGRASAMLNLDKRLSDLEEKTRAKLAELLSKLNDEVEDVNFKITNAGMLYSTVAERVKAKLQRDYESKVNECNLAADNGKNAIESERETLEQNYNRSMQELDAQRQASINQAYNKLLDDERGEQDRVIKYNNTLTEKEKKYKLTRERALESARQAEYDRTYAARKLYQQMGAVGYEEAVLWEKYNVFVAHFSTFTKREEALMLIQGDSYVQGHLKQYYTTLVDWVNRNIPA